LQKSLKTKNKFWNETQKKLLTIDYSKKEPLYIRLKNLKEEINELMPKIEDVQIMINEKNVPRTEKEKYEK